MEASVVAIALVEGRGSPAVLTAMRASGLGACQKGKSISGTVSLRIPEFLTLRYIPRICSFTIGQGPFEKGANFRITIQ